MPTNKIKSATANIFRVASESEKEKTHPNDLPDFFIGNRGFRLLLVQGPMVPTPEIAAHCKKIVQAVNEYDALCAGAEAAKKLIRIYTKDHEELGQHLYDGCPFCELTSALAILREQGGGK